MFRHVKVGTRLALGSGSMSVVLRLVASLGLYGLSSMHDRCAKVAMAHDEVNFARY